MERRRSIRCGGQGWSFCSVAASDNEDRMKETMHSEIPVARLRAVVRGLGLQNTAVCVHASLRSFGAPVPDGAAGVVRALREEDNTVMVPAFTYDRLVPPLPHQIPERN